MEIEETFGIAISDADASGMTTPAMLIAHVQEMVGSKEKEGSCLSQRAFYLIRSDLMKVTGARRSEVTLKTPGRALFPEPGREEKWREFCQVAQLENFPKLGFWRGIVFPICVEHLVREKLTQLTNVQRDERKWTHQEVRQIIRGIISSYTDDSRFSDDDEFVRDLGLD